MLKNTFETIRRKNAYMNTENIYEYSQLSFIIAKYD